jgi:phosphohistidine phosphatase
MKMKTLLLMRHAKSSWKDDDIKDFERPLKKRGKKDAPRMAEVILEEDLMPQLIISSSAVRARQTAELVAETLKFKGTLEYVDTLYMAEPPAYFDVLRALPPDVERVLVIGHNPGMEALMQILSNQVEGMPTAALAYISLPLKDWRELNGKLEGELINLWRPRDFEEGGKRHKK